MANQNPLLDAEDVVQEYVSSIGKQSLLESIPAKLLRFATATGIGAINPVAGSIASFTDSFLLSRWSRTESPRLFMKEAKQLFEEKAVEKKSLLQLCEVEIEINLAIVEARKNSNTVMEKRYNE